jgi:hypothetical protein
MAFFDIVQGHNPGKDTNFEREGLLGEMDNQCPVVHRVEKE